jgi:hypothetical protein
MLIDTPSGIYARFDINFKGVCRSGFWMYALSGAYSYLTLLGGTVSLWPVQLRLSDRMLRSEMYSVLLVGMPPNKLSVLKLRLAINTGSWH